MGQITLELPDDNLISAEEAQVAIALQLYRTGKLTYEQARSVTGDSDQFEKFAFADRERAIDLSEFISWASHDLRSPLNAIIGFTRVVLKGIDGPLNEMQTTDLTTAFNAGQRMLSLLNNLVDMARLNIGKVSLGQENLDFGQMASDIAARWQGQNTAKTLHFEKHLPAPYLAHLDSSRAKQILVSALNYTGLQIKEGGTIIFHLAQDDEGVVVNIKSSGELARDKPELDLAMYEFNCRGLIELHGGQLFLMQPTEGGAQVRFYLPA
jgi:signal transduction histidine kinase